MAISGLRIGSINCALDARSVNAIVAEALGRKAQSVTKMPDLRKEIGEQYIELVTPYVPKKTGKLRDHAYATGDGRLIWTAPYAEKQYTTQYSHYTTPGTGPYWTNYVQPGTPGYSAFIDAIQPLIIRRFQE